MVCPCPRSLEEVAHTSVAGTVSCEEVNHPLPTAISAHRRYSVKRGAPFLWHWWQEEMRVLLQGNELWKIKRGGKICWLEFKIHPSQTASKLNPGLVLL